MGRALGTHCHPTRGLRSTLLATAAAGYRCRCQPWRSMVPGYPLACWNEGENGRLVYNYKQQRAHQIGYH